VPKTASASMEGDVTFTQLLGSKIMEIHNDFALFCEQMGKRFRKQRLQQQGS
jgi:hypothetical protein